MTNTNREQIDAAEFWDVEDYAGALAGEGIDLLIEVPHGASRAADYDALAQHLRGPFREDLRDFYFVNTDVGAAALARETARDFVEAEPTRRALVLNCRIPRTFVDCNRVLDFASTQASASAESGGRGARRVTPGLPPWIVDPADEAVLRGLYAAYHSVASELYAHTCGSGAGCALMVHSYAPRSLDVPVDDAIVDRLRREYEPDRIESWPLRSPVDLIATDPQGEMLANASLVSALRSGLAQRSIPSSVSACYSLLPGTVAARLALEYPGRTLCVEFRRDLLVQRFTPFDEMCVDDEKLKPFAVALASAVRASR